MSKSPSDSDPTAAKTHGPNDSPQNASTSAVLSQADIAEAFKDLARGEQQAAALEAGLTNLEKKLDALLASIEGGSASPEASREGKGESKD
ncbi:hypothetical protein GGS23DRAFT_598202 [Durotheca rogersii]|uniref:uncharacterized protein n=1 Tax=Durotheca rogersii TaxID=419775 RepID=UPI0022202C73|nr:uncharacterized protein GGS23DRAFT_601865 [Durotheca rogersii]XP_051370509.1 uncharacterized protein GGS23DRAFT_598202 [Durotheca rogersii]KAI5850155.1 hypothetical protein GGS23DRAFT_601865 [Durotheca rogersii]KAI5861799.1 hypothetical protein GGS23DRAFT_598202 [Durotheca rogersii]